MKNALLLPLLCVFGLQAKAATDARVAAAEAAYAAGTYQEALDLYNAVALDLNSAALQYNIGNCHSKLNAVPQAILHYERALRLTPGAEDIQANLDRMRALTVDRMTSVPTFTLGTTWDRWKAGADMDQWARRALWAMLMSCALGAATVLVRTATSRRVLIGFALTGLTITGACTLLAFSRASSIQDGSQAIIMSTNLDVLSEPRAGTTKQFVLHAGTKITVLRSQGDWYEVRIANGAVGWVPVESLEVI